MLLIVLIGDSQAQWKNKLHPNIVEIMTKSIKESTFRFNFLQLKYYRYVYYIIVYYSNGIGYYCFNYKLVNNIYL